MTQIITQRLVEQRPRLVYTAATYQQTIPLNDCYAPPPADSEPRPHDLRALRAHPLLRTLPLDETFVVAFVPSRSRVALLDAAAQALLAGLPLGEACADIATLEAIDALWDAGLLVAPEAPRQPPAETQTLTAWLHVTNACNLRCTYCYIAKSNERMAPEQARRAVDAVLRSALRHGYRDVLLKYAGGEPSLALDTVALAHRYASLQAAQRGLGLSGGLLSNGAALTPARLETIRALGLRLMVSLDSLAAAHDLQRPTAGGGSSSHAVLRGIERALEAGVTPEIAITVTAQNVADLPALIDWLLARDLRFTTSFYRDHGCGGAQHLRSEADQLVEGMRAVYRQIAQRPPSWSVLGALLDRADLSAAHGRGCAAGHDYLVIGHRGQIVKCQTQLDMPITSLDDPDPLGTLRGDGRGVQSIPVDQKEGCRSCEWRYWCAGGCPIATFRATGRFDIQSPNCAIYQALYPDLLRLEGQRLLHCFQTSGPGPFDC